MVPVVLPRGRAQVVRKHNVCWVYLCHVTLEKCQQLVDKRTGKGQASRLPVIAKRTPLDALDIEATKPLNCKTRSSNRHQLFRSASSYVRAAGLYETGRAYFEPLHEDPRRLRNTALGTCNIRVEAPRACAKSPNRALPRFWVSASPGGSQCLRRLASEAYLTRVIDIDNTISNAGAHGKYFATEL